MPSSVKPYILCILDGWGLRESPVHNGIAMAKTPVWDRLMKDCSHTYLQASELSVGLPSGQMGNSEVGHMNIGAGRVVMQELPRIDAAMASGEIAQYPAFKNFCANVDRYDGTCHLLGLLSPGGVHSLQNHILGMAKLFSEQNIPVAIHAFLDGRDTPPQSAYEYLGQFLEDIKPLRNVRLATMGGRYFGMDRDKRWDRIQRAYRTIAYGMGDHVDDPLAKLKAYYHETTGDEFVPPVCMTGYHGMRDGDGLFMANFRADRVRQILAAFLKPDFHDFDRPKQIRFSATLGMSEYSQELTPLIPALFPKQSLTHTLGSVISENHLRQLRIAETEKYAHVTFFLNGGQEALFPGEERQLIPSPDVATYDLQPEMSADEVTSRIEKAVSEGTYALIVVNYANPDMVGHTGIQPAIIKAVETIDECLGRLDKVAKENGYGLIITADHGNVEQMVDEETGAPHTSHTLNPVPFVLAGDDPQLPLHPGKLSDIAPTILTLMGLPIPVEMTGKSLALT